jgi:hypothetical protein
MKKILSEEILELISMKPLSFEQIATELKIPQEDLAARGEIATILGTMSHPNRFHFQVLGLAIDHDSHQNDDLDSITGPNTFRYFRLDETKKLEEMGLISKPKGITLDSVLEDSLSVIREFSDKEGSYRLRKELF